MARGEGRGLGRRLCVQKMGIMGELRGGGGHGAKVATCHMTTIFKVGEFNQKVGERKFICPQSTPWGHGGKPWGLMSMGMGIHAYGGYA